MNQTNLLKRLIDNARRPRAIDMVDFYQGWHAAVAHFLETGLISGDPEELHNKHIDFLADEFYKTRIRPGGWLRNIVQKIRWFKREWWIDLPKRQEYLVICLTTQKWQIGIDLMGDPTISLLCLSVRLSNVPF